MCETGVAAVCQLSLSRSSSTEGLRRVALPSHAIVPQRRVKMHGHLLLIPSCHSCWQSAHGSAPQQQRDRPEEDRPTCGRTRLDRFQRRKMSILSGAAPYPGEELATLVRRRARSGAVYGRTTRGSPRAACLALQLHGHISRDRRLPGYWPSRATPRAGCIDATAGPGCVPLRFGGAMRSRRPVCISRSGGPLGGGRRERL